MGKVRKKKKNIELDEKIALCQEYTQRWGQFFNFFGDRFEGRKITAKDEARFFHAMTELARKEFRFSFFMNSDFNDGEKILDILSRSVSLNNIHEMSESQMGKLQHDWHVLFIAMNKCLGRLMQRRPPENGKKKKKRGGNGKQTKPAPAAKTS